MLRKISLLLLIASLLGTFLTACDIGNTSDSSTDSTTETSLPETEPPLLLGGKELSGYSIVCSEKNEDVRNAAEEMSLWIESKTGVKAPIISDDAEQVGSEIRIGKTTRVGSVNPEMLMRNTYEIRVGDGSVSLAAGNTLGYNKIIERLETLMNENKLVPEFTESGTFTFYELNNKRVMFIGNSFLYYGYCTTTKNKIVYRDKGYFYQVAKEMGDEVDVTSVTYGGKGLKSLYDILTENHPNYYGKSDNMDVFYKQDFVILQQEGSNAASTEEYAEKIMALFPPETKFAFFIHHHNSQNNHSNVIKTAEKLRDTKGVIYIPEGHLVNHIWSGRTKVPGATLQYNKNSFVVNHTDSHHPNYLNGYLTALSCYYGITGKSILECPYDFVKTTKEYYTKAESNYDLILKSDADMRGLKELTEQYVNSYNKYRVSED